MFAIDEARRVEAQRDALAALVGALDPGAVPLPDAPNLFALFDSIERLAAAAKILLAARVEQSGAWKRQGHRSAAEHLAALTHSSAASARDALDTSRRVATQPNTEEALRAGRLNAAQAAAVSDAAAADPTAEQTLLDTAGRESLHQLRNTCARTKANADPDPDATRRRIHAARHLRTFTSADGAWNLHAKGTPEDGAAIEAALRPHIDTRWEHARRTDTREDRDAYAFDALVELATTPATTSPATDKTGNTKPRYLTTIRVDLDALVRGRTQPGETCEIAGVGPIRVDAARQLLGESILKLVITRGVDVLNVTHLGRGPNTAQKIALLWAQPHCSREGCNRTILQDDHRRDWAQTHHTRLDELDRLCGPDHHLKTHQGWALIPGTGRRPLVPPTDPRHPRFNTIRQHEPPDHHDDSRS